MLEEAGRGVSATVSKTWAQLPTCKLGSLASLLTSPHLQVWKALCKPLNEVVAIKLLDLESVDCSLVRCCDGRPACSSLASPQVSEMCRHRAGRDSTGGSDYAAAVPPKRAPSALLVRAQAAPLDGNAVRGGWLRTEHHEIRLCRGEQQV